MCGSHLRGHWLERLLSADDKTQSREREAKMRPVARRGSENPKYFEKVQEAKDRWVRQIGGLFEYLSGRKQGLDGPEWALFRDRPISQAVKKQKKKPTTTTRQFRSYPRV